MDEIKAYFLSLDLTMWLIALGLIVLLLIINKPLAKLILRIAFVTVKRKSETRYNELREKLTGLLGYILFVGMIMIALPYINLSDTATDFISNVLATILLLLAFSALYRTLLIAVNWSFERQVKRHSNRFSPTVRNFLISGIRVALFAMAAFSILTRWVGNLSGLIAGLGISSLAVALAAQDSLSNFFGSISIMLDKPFDVGDYIVVSGDLEGTVEHVGLRSTRIRQLSGSQISVPNANLASDVVYNETKRAERRVRFSVGLEYQTSGDKLKEFIKAVEALLHDDPDVIEDSIKVWFDEFADSSLNVGIIYRTATPVYYDLLTVKDRINHAIKAAASSTGVSMAFPSISLYQAD